MSEGGHSHFLPQRGPLRFEAGQTLEKRAALLSVLKEPPTVSLNNVLRGSNELEATAEFNLESNTWHWLGGRKLSKPERESNSAILRAALDNAVADINSILRAPQTLHRAAYDLTVPFPRPRIGQRPTKPPSKPRIESDLIALRRWRRRHQRWLAATLDAGPEISEAKTSPKNGLLRSEKLFEYLMHHLVLLDWPTETRWTQLSQPAQNRLDVLVTLPETLHRPGLRAERRGFGVTVNDAKQLSSDDFLRQSVVSLAMAAAMIVGLYLDTERFQLRVLALTGDPEENAKDLSAEGLSDAFCAVEFGPAIWTSTLIGSSAPSAKSLIEGGHPGLLIRNLAGA